LLDFFVRNSSTFDAVLVFVLPFVCLAQNVCYMLELTVCIQYTGLQFKVPHLHRNCN